VVQQLRYPPLRGSTRGYRKPPERLRGITSQWIYVLSSLLPTDTALFSILWHMNLFIHSLPGCRRALVQYCRRDQDEAGNHLNRNRVVLSSYCGRNPKMNCAETPGRPTSGPTAQMTSSHYACHVRSAGVSSACPLGWLSATSPCSQFNRLDIYARRWSGPCHPLPHTAPLCTTS
jgi:hypothetical protein